MVKLSQFREKIDQVVKKKASKLKNLKKRNVMLAKPDYYVHLDWLKQSFKKIAAP